MILVDSSVWIDHIRAPDSQLTQLLETANVLQHPMVTAEIALGSFRTRAKVIELLQLLPQAREVSMGHLLRFIEDRKLHGEGIGFVDANLLAATKAEGALIWTRDKRLAAKAEALGLAYMPT